MQVWFEHRVKNGQIRVKIAYNRVAGCHTRKKDEFHCQTAVDQRREVQIH